MSALQRKVWSVWTCMGVWVCVLGTCFGGGVWAEDSVTESASSSEMVQIPAEQWTAIQSDLTAIQEQLAKDKASAAAKKEADEKKKITSPQTKVGGRFYFDMAGGSENDDARAVTGDLHTGTEFREIRLWLRGSMYDMIEYNLTFDFADNKTAMKDMYFGLYNLPRGASFRLGHFLEPWSMEELTKSAPHAFLERSYVDNMKSLCGGRNNGFMVHNWHRADRYSWATGVFCASMKDEDICFINTDSNIAWTTRLTLLPFYCETTDGQQHYWHLGASYSLRNFDQANASARGTSISVRPGSHIASAILKTGTMNGLDTMNAFQLETSICRGAFSIDAEQAFYYMEDDRCGDVLAQGGYVMGSWVLTGESRNYVKGGGYYKGIDPKSPFIHICRDGMGVFSGPGAWELAYRFAWLDLSELATGYTNGLLGEGTSHTFGLNWYLNKNCRMMFDYVLAETDYVGIHQGKSGHVDIFETRFQVVF